MLTFYKKKNYVHFMKNCIRSLYEKLKALKSGFIENSNFENNRDPCCIVNMHRILSQFVFLVAPTSKDPREYAKYKAEYDAYSDW